jgi:hypothetical protein
MEYSIIAFMKKFIVAGVFSAIFIFGAQTASAQYYPVSWSPAPSYYQPVGYSVNQYYGGSYSVPSTYGYGPLSWYNPGAPSPRGICVTGCGYPGAGMNWSPVLSRPGDSVGYSTGGLGGGVAVGGCDAFGRCPQGYVSMSANRNVWRSGDERVVRTRTSAEIFRYVY